MSRHTLSVPPATRTVPLSFIAREYTESFCPLRGIAGHTKGRAINNNQSRYMYSTWANYTGLPPACTCTYTLYIVYTGCSISHLLYSVSLAPDIISYSVYIHLLNSPFSITFELHVYTRNSQQKDRDPEIHTSTSFSFSFSSKVICTITTQGGRAWERGYNFTGQLNLVSLVTVLFLEVSDVSVSKSHT